MKKRILFTGLILLVSFFAVAEMKYIEVNEMSNISEIEFSNLEDFEPYAKGDIFYCPKTSKVYVLEGGTYYSYNLKGFKTIADLKSGINYMEANDYYEAIKLKLTDAEQYYFYKVNSFESVSDCLDAYKSGYYNKQKFNEYKNAYKNNKYNSRDFFYIYEGETIYFDDSASGTYYKAKDLGFSTPEKYAEYLFLKKHGFETMEIYRTAKSKGFKEYSEYKTATENGFSSKTTFDSAKSKGLANQDEYNQYEAFTAEIERLVKEKGFTKSEAVVYHYIAKVPKGDIAFSKLIEEVKSQMTAENNNIKTAIEKFVGQAIVIVPKEKEKEFSTRKINQMMMITETVVKNIIEKSKELGKYNSNTDIFTKR